MFVFMFFTDSSLAELELEKNYRKQVTIARFVIKHEYLSNVLFTLPLSVLHNQSVCTEIKFLATLITYFANICNIYKVNH